MQATVFGRDSKCSACQGQPTSLWHCSRNKAAANCETLQKLRSQVHKADHNWESKEKRSPNKIGKRELLDPETQTCDEHFTLS